MCVSEERQKTKSASLIGNVRKSTKANGREEQRELDINVLGGGSRQASTSPLALFTRQAE